MKTANNASLGEEMDAIGDCLHGWLVFDPLKGFLCDEMATPTDQKLQDILVWLMNMLALYSDCAVEKTLTHFDFLVHHIIVKICDALDDVTSHKLNAVTKRRLVIL